MQHVDRCGVSHLFCPTCVFTRSQCPYEVYCPAGPGRSSSDGSVGEAWLSWAPVLDRWDEWVQLGDGDARCATSFGAHRGPVSGNATDRALCCLERPFRAAGRAATALPEETTEVGWASADEASLPVEAAGPVSPVDAEEAASLPEEMTEVEWASADEASLQEEAAGPVSPAAATGAPSFDGGAADQQGLSPKGLLVAKTYSPVWYTRHDGYTGTTYEESLAFCARQDRIHWCLLS